MTDAPIFSVRGETVLEAPPEIARVSVRVQVKDRDRRRALDQLTERNRSCLALVEEYGEAVEKVETQALTVTPVIRYGRREGDVRHYQGTVWIKLTVNDFGVLGELLARLGELDLAAVDGPYWELRHDSEVHRRAARQAAQEAVTRARSYAEALGCRLTGLLELSDEGLSSHGAGRPEASFALAAQGMPMTRAGRPDEPEPIDLEPETQIVRAAVEARFTTTAPAEL